MRTKLYFKSIGAAYVLLAVNIGYSLAVIPLVLHYIGKSEFGLWALTLQIGIVLKLADGGLSAALTRILIEYKDDKELPAYRQTLYTVWLALTGFAALIALLMWPLSVPLASLFRISSEYMDFYPRFISIYTLVFAASVAIKPINLVLVAHQRQYLFSISSIIGLIVAFPILWLSLASGWGLWSLVVAQGSTMFLTNTINLAQARSRGYLPPFSLSDCLQLARLKEVASFASQRITAAFGNTVLLTAPTFLITRFIGLEATAIWTIGTRIMQLSSNVAAKLVDVSQPILTEMYVRGEHIKLRKRFADVVVLTLGVVACFAGLITASNDDFVHLWTDGKIAWDGHLDKFIAVYFVLKLLQRLFWMPVLISKNLGFARFMSMVEAALVLAIFFSWPTDSPSLDTVISALIFAVVFTSLPVYIVHCAPVLDQKITDILSNTGKSLLCTVVPLIATGVILDLIIPSEDWYLLSGKSVIMCIASGICLFALPKIRHPLLQFGSRILKRNRPLPSN